MGARQMIRAQGRQRFAKNAQAPSSAVQQAKGVAGVLRSTGEAAAAKWSASPGSKVGRGPPRGAPPSSSPLTRHTRASFIRAPCSAVSHPHLFRLGLLE